MENSLNQAPKRLDFVDVCKAFGIIVVVVGHLYTIPSALYTALISFSMPVFFVISGFVYNKEKNKNMGFLKYLKRKIKQYLIPYYILGFANLGIDILINVFWKNIGVSKEYLIANIKGILLFTEPLPNCVTLWFLICLFFASLLFWFVMYVDLKYTFIIVSMILGYYFCYIYYLNGIKPFDFIPFNYVYPACMLAVFFLYIGFCFRLLYEKYLKKLTTIQGTVISVFVIVVSISTVLLTENVINMLGQRFSNVFVFLFTSTFTSVSIILFFSKVHLLENRFFLWIGKNTLYIMAFNYQCMYIESEFHYFIPFLRSTQLHWTAEFAIVFLLCLLTVAVCNFIKNQYAKIICAIKHSKGTALS